MPIQESQLDTWAHQGAGTGSKATYATVKLALESGDAPYAAKSFITFLQGSYCNDTNIYAESDVDVVIRLDSIYYPDLSGLSQSEKVAYERDRTPVTYSLETFKQDVLATLTKRFGSAAKAGRKAITIEASGGRRKADVIVAAMHRKFHAYPVRTQPPTEGILFLADTGARIINFPKLHSANCSAKHQATAGWFKPAVRIMKNVRGRLVATGKLASGAAPSYFLEGLLYNVPNDRFGTNYSTTIYNVLTWIASVETTKLVCANGQHPLCGEGTHVGWKPADADAFIAAAVQLWNDRS